jgi:murein DD-endopeptidase MepM/ murein hydrolase activator NlpD
MVQKGFNMSRLYNPFMPSLTFASGLLRDTDGGGGGGGDDGGNDNNNSTTVQAGDTMSEIAEANNMSVEELAAANNITNVDQIQVGQTLDLSGANSGSSTYNNGVGAGGIGSNNNDDDDPSPLESAVASGQVAVDTFPSYDAFGNEYSTSGEAAAADNYAELQASTTTGTYDEVPQIQTPNTGSTYDEIPQVNSSNTYYDMDMGEAGRGANTGTSASFGEEAAKAISMTDNEMSALDQLADDNFNASFDDDKNLITGSVVDNIANAAATGNTNTDMLGNSADVLERANIFQENASNQNAGNNNTTELTDAQVANSMGESELDNVSKILINDYGWSLSEDGTTAVNPTNNKGYNGVDYNDPSEAEAAKAAQNDAENAGSTYDDAPILAAQDPQLAADAVIDNKMNNDNYPGETVDEILVEKYGWTMGDDGKVVSPGGQTIDEVNEATKGGDGNDNPVVVADDDNPVVVNDDDDNPVVVPEEDLPPQVGPEVDPERDPEVEEEVEPEVDPEVDPEVEGETVDPNDADDVFADQNDDGTISSLEATIANLRQQLALLTNSSTQETDGLSREEILALIAEAMRNNNSNSYNPLAYMNAFGFSAQPSYFGNPIPTYMSQDGVYERRAVKDRDTGEIRYVNVPIGNASLTGTGGFQRRRRAGFGGNFDTF